MLTSESILEAVGTTLVQDIIRSQANKGIRASGRSAKSLSFTVTRKGNLVTLIVTGASYFKQQQNGKKPDGRPGRPSNYLINHIRQWIKDKNLSIPLKAAGAIAYNVKNRGWTVPNRYNPGGVISEPLNRQRIMSILHPKLSKAYTAEFTAKLFKI